MDQPGNESLTVAHHFRIKTARIPTTSPAAANRSGRRDWRPFKYLAAASSKLTHPLAATAAAPKAMHQRDWEKTVKLSNGELYKGEGSPSRCSITNPVQDAMSRGARISMLTVPMMISLTNRQPEKGHGTPS